MNVWLNEWRPEGFSSHGNGGPAFDPVWCVSSLSFQVYTYYIRWSLTGSTLHSNNLMTPKTQNNKMKLRLTSSAGGERWFAWTMWQNFSEFGVVTVHPTGMCSYTQQAQECCYFYSSEFPAQQCWFVFADDVEVSTSHMTTATQPSVTWVVCCFSFKVAGREGIEGEQQ